MICNNYYSKYTVPTGTVLKLLVGPTATLVFLTTQAIAAPQGHLKVTSKMQKMEIIKKGGKQTYRFVPATKVLPGEIVQYNTFYENISNKPAGGINIVNAIPKHTVYLPHSAQGKNTQSVFSVDGGKHYGKAGTLKVRGKDGKLHPAKPSDYTHIRWHYQGNLAPKTKQAVAFRVRLR